MPVLILGSIYIERQSNPERPTGFPIAGHINRLSYAALDIYLRNFKGAGTVKRPGGEPMESWLPQASTSSLFNGDPTLPACHFTFPCRLPGRNFNAVI
jgi:hypothetical protein